MQIWLDARLDAEGNVVDRETGEPVTLVGLLSSYREHLDEPVIGRVRITIEPEVVR